jgi:hypothetical protein
MDFRYEMCLIIIYASKATWKDEYIVLRHVDIWRDGYMDVWIGI